MFFIYYLIPFFNVYIYFMDQWIGMGISHMKQFENKAKLNMKKWS